MIQSGSQSDNCPEIDTHVESVDSKIYYKTKLQELVQSEVDLLTNLSHSNIIKLFDYQIIINEHVFEYNLHFEYMNCGDLYSVLKNKKFEAFYRYRSKYGGFNEELIVYIIKELQKGLQYLHSKSIIHKDFKLQNILIGTTNQFKKINDYQEFNIKISDLGFSCINPEDDYGSKDLPQHLIPVLKNKWKKLCGTPYYMAPEMLNMFSDLKVQSSLYNLCYSTKIDIWSLGLVIYEMHFNQLPLSNIKSTQDLVEFYKKEHVQEFLYNKINKDYFIFNIIKGCLVIEQSERFDISQVNEQFNQVTININKQELAIVDTINDNTFATAPLKLLEKTTFYLKKSSELLRSWVFLK